MLLVSVWRTSAVVVYYSLLKSGHTVTADIYCQELQIVMEKRKKYGIDLYLKN